MADNSGLIREHLAAGRLEEAWRAASVLGLGGGPEAANALLLQALVRSRLPGQGPEDIVDAAEAAAAALEEAGDAQGAIEGLRLAFDAQLRLQQYAAAAQTGRRAARLGAAGGLDAESAAAQLLVAAACAEAEEADEAQRAVEEALRVYRRLGDRQGEARCHVQAGKAHLRGRDTETALEDATAARELARAAKDPRGEADAALLAASALQALGDLPAARRSAEDAARLFRCAGDAAAEVDALVADVEAQMRLLEQRSSLPPASFTPVVRAAEVALAAARARRPGDLGCLGGALAAHARALLFANAPKGAWRSAKDAARCFRKVGGGLRRARALALWAEADLVLGYPAEARGTAQTALGLFDKVGDAEGAALCEEICDRADAAMGVPTRAQLAEQAQREFEMQQHMLAQYQAAQLGQAVVVHAMPVSHFDDEPPAPGGAQPLAFKRDGASPLQVSAGMDAGVVQSKIRELAAQIIGDSEDIDLDTPLLEAGLTSNTAVILRDELTKDLPGIGLPPTLIFDYPSVGAISEYILEKSKSLK